MSKLFSLAYYRTKYAEQISYVFFGGLTTLVNFGVFALCFHVLHLDTVPANVVAWIVSVLFAYITNRIWVFRSEKTGKRAILRESIAFFTARGVTLVLETALMYLFIDWLGLNDLIVKILAQLFVVVLNYFLSKLIFRGKK